MAHDPNEKKEVQTKEKFVQLREKRQQQETADDVRAVMSTPEGRRLMNGLIGLSGVRESPYRPGHLDQQRHQDYLLGRQSIGLQLIHQIETHAPNDTELMAAEARRRAAQLQAEIEAEDALFDDPETETEQME